MSEIASCDTNAPLPSSHTMPAMRIVCCASSTVDGLINTATTRISIKTRQIWMMKLAMAQKIFPMGDAVSMAIHFVRIFTLLLENYNLWNFIIVFLRLKKNYSLLKDVSSGNLSQIPILVFWTKTMITQSWTMFQTSDKPVILSKTLWFNSILHIVLRIVLNQDKQLII